LRNSDHGRPTFKIVAAYTAMAVKAMMITKTIFRFRGVILFLFMPPSGPMNGRRFRRIRLAPTRGRPFSIPRLYPQLLKGACAINNHYPQSLVYQGKIPILF